MTLTGMPLQRLSSEAISIHMAHGRSMYRVGLRPEGTMIHFSLQDMKISSRIHIQLLET